MNIADHLRPLLRDHDCVIIPDFGGLVAEYSPARVQPGGRHVISPPSRQVAFNQALTRNDGLLVDALRQHLDLPAAEAREAVRQAVAALHHDLSTQQHTTLPGVGVFRQVAGRGLQFEYTGTDNLLPGAFGLPELLAHPVRVTDARLAREQQAQLVPRLRAAGRNLRLRRLVPGAAIGLLAGLAVAGLYLANLHPALVPVAWRGYVPQWQPDSSIPAAQQATLAHTGLSTAPVALVPVAAAAPLATPTAVPTEVESTAADTAATMAIPATESIAPPAAAPASAVATPVASGKVAASPAKKEAAAKVALVAAPVTVKVPVATTGTTTIKARTGRYYVIVAAYSSLARAEEGRRTLAKVGRPAKIILPYWGTRHFRLSAADYADQATASFAAQRLRHTPSFDKGSSVLAY